MAINMQPGPAGRSAGSVAWARLFNTYFWVDPTKRVTGTIMTQLLPFADPEVLKLFAKFESGLYAAVSWSALRKSGNRFFAKKRAKSKKVESSAIRPDRGGL
jgi:hypothetical protein